MPNVFLALPAPAGNGSGAWVDCAAMGAHRNIVVGGAMHGTVNIEISNEAVPSSAAPVASVVNKGDAVVECAAKWMRATVVGYQDGGAPVIEVGSTDDGTTIANLAVTAGSGTGAPTDVSDLPLWKTVTVGGTWSGTVLIEYSEDGIDFAPWSVITAPGAVSGPLIASDMRVTRQAVKAGALAGTPLVDVGGASLGGGGGSSFGDPQIQRFTAAGGEQDFNVTLDVPRGTDVYSVWPTQAGMAAYVAIDCPDVLAGDRTTTTFRVVTSGVLTAGDQIDFLIADR